jgi:uncharacterized protein (TIGR03084 family)
VADLTAVLADLTAESAELDAVVAGLPESEWARHTPSEGWTIAHQIAHLAWTDDVAQLAVTDPEAFQAQLQEVIAEFEGYVDRAAVARAAEPPAVLLESWRAGRSALASALAAVPQGTKVPWFGPPMSPASMATARIMETWAHGQDVADALGITRLPSARLRNVAHIGVRTRDFAFLLHDRPTPTAPFRVELSAPNGERWSWGPDDAEQWITGPALDFCLLVTQRRNRADLALRAHGADADAWLDIAQAFAGPPGGGRPAAEASG